MWRGFRKPRGERRDMRIEENGDTSMNMVGRDISKRISRHQEGWEWGTQKEAGTRQVHEESIHQIGNCCRFHLCTIHYLLPKSFFLI